MTNKQPYDSKIDYLEAARRLINRPGKAYNPCSGCLHTVNECACADQCWAKECIRTRLRDNPSYPYGTQPTYRPEMIHPVGKRSQWLIALNFMGDVGGDWNWREFGAGESDIITPENLAGVIQRFAASNPQHILLLLTKRPEWYGLADWPDNVWCGFSASNNREWLDRSEVIYRVAGDNWWASLEPWLDNEAPVIPISTGWLVIGGLSKSRSGPARPVSVATRKWIEQFKGGKLFVKSNVGWAGMPDAPREYPSEWRVEVPV